MCVPLLTPERLLGALNVYRNGEDVGFSEHEVFGAEGSLEEELAALRARGAQVALDDAGAGYAGLRQIIRIAPDILTLDRALIHGAHADPSRQALLEAQIGFASSTGAAICAESVEDLEDCDAALHRRS